MTDNRITAIVHTYNAREHLGRVLDTLQGFDELLVVDMESTDDTCAIAREKGARVITFERGEHRIAEPLRVLFLQSGREKPDGRVRAR